jgi:hypothetical protein
VLTISNVDVERQMLDRLCKEMGPENTSIIVFTVRRDGCPRRRLLHVFSHWETKFSSTEQGQIVAVLMYAAIVISP